MHRYPVDLFDANDYVIVSDTPAAADEDDDLFIILNEPSSSSGNTTASPSPQQRKTTNTDVPLHHHIASTDYRPSYQDTMHWFQPLPPQPPPITIDRAAIAIVPPPTPHLSCTYPNDMPSTFHLDQHHDTHDERNTASRHHPENAPRECMFDIDAYQNIVDWNDECPIAAAVNALRSPAPTDGVTTVCNDDIIYVAHCNQRQASDWCIDAYIRSHMKTFCSIVSCKEMIYAPLINRAVEASNLDESISIKRHVIFQYSGCIVNDSYVTWLAATEAILDCPELIVENVDATIYREWFDSGYASVEAYAAAVCPSTANTIVNQWKPGIHSTFIAKYKSRRRMYIRLITLCPGVRSMLSYLLCDPYIKYYIQLPFRYLSYDDALEELDIICECDRVSHYAIKSALMPNDAIAIQQKVAVLTGMNINDSCEYAIRFACITYILERLQHDLKRQSLLTQPHTKTKSPLSTSYAVDDGMCSPPPLPLSLPSTSDILLFASSTTDCLAAAQIGITCVGCPWGATSSFAFYVQIPKLLTVDPQGGFAHGFITPDDTEDDDVAADRMHTVGIVDGGIVGDDE